MKKVLSAIMSMLNYIYRLLLEYSKIVLLLLVIIISTQVVSRKFFNHSIRWSEETALLLMVWMAFIAMAIGVANNLHISITIFYDMFPPVLRKIVDKINLVVTFFFGVLLFIYGLKLISSTLNSTLPATKLPAFMLYLMIPVSGFYICYYSFLKAFNINKFKHSEFDEDNDDNEQPAKLPEEIETEDSKT